MEIFKNIPNYEGIYQISNLGNIKSLSRKCKMRYGFYISKEFLLKHTKNSKGYIQTCLRKDNIDKNVLFHRLVAEVFISNPLNKKEVNHINGIKNDNRVENLEWCTRTENERHSWNVLNKKPYWNKSNGVTHSKSLPVNKMDLMGNYLESYGSVRCAARENNITSSSGIIKCCKGKLKKHHGFIWEYKKN